MTQRIQLRRGTAAEWTAANPTLASGEPGRETDTGKQKTGDGATAWNSLAYDINTADLASTASGNGAALVGFKQVGTGAVDRTVLSKAREIAPSPADYSTTYSSSPAVAIQAAIDASAALNSRLIVLPDGDVTIASDILLTSRKAVLQFGAGTYTFASGASIKVDGEKNVTIVGRGIGMTKLLGTTAGQKLIQFSGVHTGGASNRQTVISDLTLDGGGVAAYGAYAPDNSVGVFTMLAAPTIYARVRATGFLSAGICHGKSNYFIHLDKVYFDNNAIGSDIGEQTDCIYSGCFYGKHSVAGAKMRCTQQRFRSCSFIGEGAAGPDILIAPSASSGVILIDEGCYFGPENDSSSRKKIVVNAGSTDVNVSDVIVRGFFFGVAGQTCIDVLTPIRNWDIDAHFDGFSTIINDGVSTYPSDPAGGCKFRGMVRRQATAATTLFTNGGRFFSDVAYPVGCKGITVPDTAAGPLQNRLHYSEDFVSAIDSYSWSKSAAITITAGQADSAGTTKAAKLSHAGGASSQSVVAKIDLTNLKTDTAAAASGGNGRVVARLRLKAGSFDVADVVVRDTIAGKSLRAARVSLGPVFCDYVLVFTGIDPSHVTDIRIYPGGTANSAAGDMYIEFPSVSDFGSAYTATSGSAVGV